MIAFGAIANNFAVADLFMHRLGAGKDIMHAGGLVFSFRNICHIFAMLEECVLDPQLARCIDAQEVGSSRIPSWDAVRPKDKFISYSITYSDPCINIGTHDDV